MLKSRNNSQHLVWISDQIYEYERSCQTASFQCWMFPLTPASETGKFICEEEPLSPKPPCCWWCMPILIQKVQQLLLYSDAGPLTDDSWALASWAELLIGGWLAVTQGGSGEVLAHSHCSREGLQSHTAHSCSWLFSGIYSELITARSCFGTHIFVAENYGMHAQEGYHHREGNCSPWI